MLPQMCSLSTTQIKGLKTKTKKGEEEDSAAITASHHNYHVSLRCPGPEQQQVHATNTKHTVAGSGDVWVAAPKREQLPHNLFLMAANAATPATAAHA